MDVFTVLRWVVHNLIVFMNVPIEDGDGFQMLRCTGVAAVETLFDVVAFKRLFKHFGYCASHTLINLDPLPLRR